MGETKIIAIANQKGGVGKTTTAINIATGIAAVGNNTLIIDLDPQGNGSTGLGIDNNDREFSSYEVLVNQINCNDAIKKTLISKLDIIPANINLAAAEIELNEFDDKQNTLKKSLENITKSYDYIIIDCPPSLGLLTLNALCAASSLIIPLQCEFFALEGLVKLINTYNIVYEHCNPQLKIEGIVLTMVDRRNRLSAQVENDVRSTYKELVYNTTIPRNVRVSEAPSFGQPVMIYDNRSNGAEAYTELTKEILNKIA